MITIVHGRKVFFHKPNVCALSIFKLTGSFTAIDRVGFVILNSLLIPFLFLLLLLLPGFQLCFAQQPDARLKSESKLELKTEFKSKKHTEHQPENQIQVKPASFPFAQTYFETVGDSESIPSGNVMALAQDAKGMLWIGTQNGLILYDAYRFRKYLRDPKDLNSIAGNYVQTIWPAPDGKVWIGTSSEGLSVFDPATEKFTNFKHDPQNPDSLSRGRIRAIAGDADHGLWIGTESGLDYLAKGTGKFIHFRQKTGDPTSLADDRIRSLLFDMQGRLWVGSANGLQRLRQDRKSFEAIGAVSTDAKQAHSALQLHSLAGQEITALFQAKDGKLWIASAKQGAAWIDPTEQQPQLHSIAVDSQRKDCLNHGWINTIAQVQDDQIWLGSYGGGINVVDASDGKVLKHINHHPSLPSSLALDSISRIITDRSGLVWVGTLGAGLQKHVPANRSFYLLRHSPSLAEGLSHPNIRSILELSDGRILVGTDGKGIDIIDRNRGLIGSYRDQLEKPGSLGDSSILSLAQTHDGAIWAGTRLAGVQRLAAGSQRWEKFSVADGVPDSPVRRLLVTSNGDLWAGTNAGVVRWNPQKKKFEAVKMADQQTMTFAASSMEEDQYGRVWVGGVAGLWFWDPQSNQMQAVVHDDKRHDSLSFDDINGILRDHQGQLWVDTVRGLERFKNSSKLQSVADIQFEHISELVKRSGVSIGEMLEDKTGRIWSSEFLLDPAQMRMYDLSRADGFDIGVGWLGSTAKTRDGLLLFGGTQGLAVVDPERFQVWSYNPPVVATELKINGFPAPLSLLESKLILNQEQRNFTLEFSALDYSAPQKNRYQYRLQSYDKDWINSDAEHRSVSYGNLWPGHYTLQVRASNRNGDWSPYELSIPIQILPAFWQSAWFVGSVIILILISATALYHWRILYLRKISRQSQLQLENQAKALKHLVDARTADILKLGEIGQELTSTLETEIAFEKIYQQVSVRLDAHVFRIGIYDEANGLIRLDYIVEDGVRQQPTQVEMSEKNSVAVWCVREKRELIAMRNEQLLNFVEKILPAKYGKAMETIVFIPLIAKQKVIGCLSVQSPLKHAYSVDQYEFLRVLSSYIAIALANSLVHKSLLETQRQLTQQEKMASLGQLVANVAHEINTPIGAIKSSGKTILDALNLTIENLPALLILLDEEQRVLFLCLLKEFSQTSAFLSSREERSLTREISQKLDAAGITESRRKADILVQLRAHHAPEKYFPLLKSAQAELILSTAYSVATLVYSTKNINTAVEHVAKIVFTLKSFSRSEGKQQMQWADLREGLETVLSLYHPQIKNGCELICQFQEIPALLCYPDELIQVWINLIYNALQAMNFNGVLNISLSRDKDEALIAISDTGSGIPEEIRDKIFEPFFTTKPKGEGSGLGLDIIKKIILKHHGRIHFQTEIGRGTTFYVHLPYSIDVVE